MSVLAGAGGGGTVGDSHLIFLIHVVRYDLVPRLREMITVHEHPPSGSGGREDIDVVAVEADAE